MTFPSGPRRRDRTASSDPTPEPEGPPGSGVRARPASGLPALVSLGAGIAVFLVSAATEGSLPLSPGMRRALSWGLIALGLGLVAWAVAHLGGGLLGSVEPRAERLVTRGPYRLVRHPVYLGLTVALAGVPVAMGSAWGLAAALLLFLPATIYRARREDRALARRFGQEWRRYARRTGFPLPRPARRLGPSAAGAQADRPAADGGGGRRASTG